MTEIANNVPSPAPKWVERFARFGLTAKGVVYCLVGILAFMAAFEMGSTSSGKEADKQSVFVMILQQPFGKVLLAIIAVGLISYSIWRFIEAVYDTENKGTEAKGIGRRIGYFFSGLVYGALAFYAAKLVLGSSNSDNSDSRQTLARELLDLPMGQWILGAIGLGTILLGFYQIYRGWSGKYKKHVQKAGLKHEVEEKMIKAGKFGYMARGVVWILIGWLFIRAAMQNDSQEAGGSGSAFQFLEEASYGSYLLGAVALGLICYGVFMFMRARYQPINSA